MTLLRGQIYLYAERISDEGEILLPGVIIQNNVGNYQKPTTIIAPILTLESKVYVRSHVQVLSAFLEIENLPRIKGTICTERIRTIDKSRMRGYLGTLNRCGLEMLDKALAFTLDMKGTQESTEGPVKGQIYYCNLSDNSIGYEMQKLRPVIVVQGNIENSRSTTVVVVPITTKRGDRFFSSHVHLEDDIMCKGKRFKTITGTACSEQIRTIPMSSLKSPVGCLNDIGIKKVDKTVSTLLNLLL